MSSKRERLEIINDILNIIMAKGGNIKPTQIMYKANLSHLMLNEYISELIEKKFIAENIAKNGRKTYSLTDKGYNFIKDFKVIRGFIESYGLES